MRAARRIGGILAALGLWLAAAPARAVEPYLVTVGVLGGLGGPLDADGADPGLSNRSLQLEVGLVTEESTRLSLRLARLDFSDEGLGDLTDPELAYATVAGEYRFARTFYDSGFFLGLGAYRLEGDRGGRRREQTTLGATLGVTAEIELNRYVGVVGELAGHYADFDNTKIFGTLHGGLSVKF